MFDVCDVIDHVVDDIQGRTDAARSHIQQVLLQLFDENIAQSDAIREFIFVLYYEIAIASFPLISMTSLT